MVPLLELLKSFDSDVIRQNENQNFLYDDSFHFKSIRRNAKKRTINIIEPHLDDAVLSLGGFLQSGNYNINVFSVFSKSQQAHHLIKPLLERTNIDIETLRKSENKSALELLDIKNYQLDFPDDEINSISESTFYKLFSDIRDTIKELIPIKELVFIPAGFGNNPHHRIISQLKSVFPNHILYEDVSPIFSYSRSIEDFWKLYSEMLRDYEPSYIDIDMSIDTKISLLSLYRSQFTKLQVESIKKYQRSVAVSANLLDTPHHYFKFAERVYIPRNNSNLLNIFVDEEKENTSNYKKVINLSIAKNYSRVFPLRESRRDIINRKIDLKTIGDILFLAAKKLDEVKTPSFSYKRFPYPNAGGIGSMQIFLVVWNVSSLDPAVYYYNSSTHQLELYNSKQISSLDFRIIADRQDWVLGASCALIISSKNESIYKKYNFRAKYLLYSEAGHLSQIIQMAVAKYNLGSVVLGGFDVDKLREITSPFSALSIILLGKLPSAKSEAKFMFKGTLPQTDAAFNVKKNNNLKCDFITKNIQFTDSSFSLARYYMPDLDIWTTGYSLYYKKELQDIKMQTAKMKAISEAAELSAGLIDTPKSLIYSSAQMLGNEAVLPSKFLLDASQMKSLKEKKTDSKTHESEKIYWINAYDIISGSNVWIPSETVLISKRFINYKILPTSSGLGCGYEINQALTHALLEAFEKKIFQYIDANNIIYEGKSKLESERFLSDIENYFNVKLNFKIYKYCNLYLAKAWTKTYYGSCCSFNPENALKNALAELCAKLVDGSNEGVEFNNYDAIISHANDLNYIDGLRKSGIGLAVVMLNINKQLFENNKMKVLKIIPYWK